MENNTREQRLPVWAQDELRTLRMNLTHARKEIRQLTTEEGLPRSNFHISVETLQPVWRPSFHSRVRCYIGSSERDWIELYHDQSGGEQGLALYGERQLLLLPRVSNVAFVQLRGR